MTTILDLPDTAATVTAEPHATPVRDTGRRPEPPEHPPGAAPAAVPHRRRITRSGWITAGIAACTATLLSWSLWSVGYANSYYAAAVKSASVSWKAWFFGSIDPGSFITVDKPPAALWIQGLSARILGFSSFSMLLPQVLCGVASVLLLHHLVRRWRGDVAAHLAALALAVTPIAVAMFRNNNPDAFLTFLGVAGAWAVWRAVETGRTRFLLAAAAITGLAFNTKMLQAFLVVPAFVLVYVVAGPPKLGRRILQLLAALVTLVVSAGWWMVVVALWPASSRPYIGSTSDNSIFSLMLGYNGLDRVFGSGTGAGPGGGGGGFGGTPGWLRLFNSESGGLISWLLPLAGAGLLAGLWLTRRNARTDRTRAGWLLWGGWALTCVAVFSLSKGIFHPYYEVQLAPAVAALAGAGSVALSQLGRRHRFFVWALPAAVFATAAWAIALLDRVPSYAPWLHTAILVGAAVSVAGLLIGSLVRRRVLVVAAAAVAAVSVLAGPTAYSLSTVANPVSGSIVTAGPSSSTGGGFGGNGGPGGSGGSGGGVMRGGPGASTSVDRALVTYLEEHQGSATYLVAVFGSQSSASIIIATGKPVITIGGFNGGDPAPTLEQFKALVASGKVRYLVVSNGGMGGPGGGSTSSIASWAASNGTVVDYGGSSGTLYLLSADAS